MDRVAGFTGGGGGGPRGGSVNSASVFIQLKPLAERHYISTDEVSRRLNGKLNVGTAKKLAGIEEKKAAPAPDANENLSPLTVKTHVKHAMDKLEADTRTEAVASALRQSLIT